MKGDILIIHSFWSIPPIKDVMDSSSLMLCFDSTNLVSELNDTIFPTETLHLSMMHYFLQLSFGLNCSFSCYLLFSFILHLIIKSIHLQDYHQLPRSSVIVKADG